MEPLNDLQKDILHAECRGAKWGFLLGFIVGAVVVVPLTWHLTGTHYQHAAVSYGNGTYEWHRDNRFRWIDHRGQPGD